MIVRGRLRGVVLVVFRRVQFGLQIKKLNKPHEQSRVVLVIVTILVASRRNLQPTNLFWKFKVFQSHRC